jgi:probable rRNA maturation factor
VPLLRRITRTLVRELLHKNRFELGVYLVDEPEITQLNEAYVRHKGPTDVITFDYCDAHGLGALAGEIFLCIDEACIQARRFRTTWQSEVVRYVVHGVLHLSGYDDRRESDRRRMKWAEDGLVTQLERRFSFKELQMKTRRSKAEARKKAETQRPKRKSRTRHA